MRATHLLVPLLLSPILLAQQDPQRPVATTQALDPAGTASRMIVPAGFRVELIAGEPTIAQPIAYTQDDKGRLWVLENTNYPESPGHPKDRIVVLEDTNGDGSFDKNTVFLNNLTFSSGIAVGFGGVWIGSPPNLLFIPDKNADAIPDGPPQIILDGWGAEDTHETLNNFTWGPDGWLYGTHGIFTFSNIGAPGTPENNRVHINAAVWRYHPTRKVFERWCEGASNQWGLDWNDHGEAFFAACVIPHMWHAIEGAHYTRQAGSHENPHTYQDIQTIAWGRYEKAGYCGAMIYLGGAFPDEWRNNFFFHDVHLNKLRCETFTKSGSGYRSHRKTDFLHSPDAWFRGLSPQYGPDGGVFISDWYDKVPCHQQRAFTDRSNGRIYKIVNDQVKPRKVDLTSATDAELVALMLDPNDWHVRHARRILQERGPNPKTTAALEAILFKNPDDTRQLRALWTLHSQQALTEASALRALNAPSEYVRGWTITCITEQGNPSPALLTRLTELAAKDPSPAVRLRLASALQKLPPATRWPILLRLASNKSDLEDPNIPLMLWYAAEPAVAAAPLSAINLLKSTTHPRLQQFIPRRIMSVFITDEEKAAPAMSALATTLSESASPLRSNILTGLLEAAKGRKRITQPQAWPAAYQNLITDPDENVRQKTQALALLFGSTASLDELRARLKNSATPVESRRTALQSLVTQRDSPTLPILLEIAKTNDPLRIDAITALSHFDDPSIPTSLLDLLPTLNPDEKSAALTTLVSRPSNIEALLKSIDSGKLPTSTITAPLANLIHAAKRDDFNQWLSKNWGSLQPSDAERLAEIERYRKFLGTEAILRADPKNGAAIYQRTCSACHILFGKGGNIGPHLPGNFTDTDYLLQNILDPDAIIGKDYQQTHITTKSGNLLAGVLTAEDDQTLTLKTLAAPITLNKNDIAKRELTTRSMMPTGLLNSLTETEVRDLFLYLRQSHPPK
jgi:putative membrane-bound dehydrogenase-like protein